MSAVLDIGKQTLEEAFPETDPGAKPFGTGVLIQLRSPKRFSGGIMLTEESQEQERWMTTIGKVISLGPLAFKNREDPTKEWPEGAWCKVGDFVRCPKWGGDRWQIAVGREKDFRGRDVEIAARFVIFKDRELNAGITGDPLSFIDYV